MYPYLLRIGSLYLPTFGVLAAVGCMVALFQSQRTAKLVGLDPDRLWDAGLFAIIAAFSVSRVLLVLANLRTFLNYPMLLLMVPSLTATGLLLTAFATLLWLRRKRIPVLRAYDAWAPCATMLWSFLALGHFAEGSDLGVSSRFGLLVRGETVRLVPVALYAAGAAVAASAGLWWLLGRSKRAGEIAGAGLAFAGLAQFLLSFWRQPSLTGVAGLDLLQWVALGMVTAGGALLSTARRVA